MTALAPEPPRPQRAGRPRCARWCSSAGLAGAAVFFTACTATSGLAEPNPAPQPGVPAGPLPVSAAARPTSSAAVKKSWAKSFVGVQKKLSGTAGVAIVPVGSTQSADLLNVGRWKTGVAWSTSKVPVTVAAQRKSASKTTKARSTKAITISDNQAA